MMFRKEVENQRKQVVITMRPWCAAAITRKIEMTRPKSTRARTHKEHAAETYAGGFACLVLLYASSREENAA